MTSRIAIVGTGYVGLTTGAGFAHIGHDVVCADIDRHKIDQLNRGEIPILEPGLAQLVNDGVAEGRLRFVAGARNAVADCDFAYLCVPTPQTPDGSADLSYIEAAAREIAPVMPPGSVVVNKSTVPVGSTAVVERAMARPDIKVVSNPEFLREGSAVHDFLNPDRVVIGTDDRPTAVKVASLFLGLTAPVIVTDPASAETIKYAANSFLATKLSFVNAMAEVCESVGANISDVVKGIGTDPRIGREFLAPGPGWGGSCFPKDTRALVRIAEEAGYDFAFLRGVIEANDQQFEKVARRIGDLAGGDLGNKKIAVLGLTFKANTDDLRDSPALEVVNRLVARGASVVAYDPAVHGDLPGMDVVDSAIATAKDADVLAVLTEWDEFRFLDLKRIASIMKTPFAYDTRNIINPAAAAKAGLELYRLGHRSSPRGNEQ